MPMWEMLFSRIMVWQVADSEEQKMPPVSLQDVRG